MVSEVHGTTRDWLEGDGRHGGHPRAPVRHRGPAQHRATRWRRKACAEPSRCLRAADLVVYLVDGTRGLMGGRRRVVAWHGGPPCPSSGPGTRSTCRPGCRLPRDSFPSAPRPARGSTRSKPRLPPRFSADRRGNPAEPLIDSERQRDLLDRRARGAAALPGRRAPGDVAGPPCRRPRRGARCARRDHRRGDERGDPRADVLPVLRGEIAWRMRGLTVISTPS